MIGAHGVRLQAAAIPRASSVRAIAPFSAGVRGRSVDPVTHRRSSHHQREVELHLRALEEGDLHQPALDRERRRDCAAM